MNVPIRQLLSLALSVVLFAGPALAHDPKEHAAEAADPDCAAMKNMDPEKMDMSDPVVQALHEKCMGMDRPGHGHATHGMEGAEGEGTAPSASSSEHAGRPE